MACMLEPVFFSQISPKYPTFHLGMYAPWQRKELAILPYMPMGENEYSL